MEGGKEGGRKGGFALKHNFHNGASSSRYLRSAKTIRIDLLYVRVHACMSMLNVKT